MTDLTWIDVVDTTVKIIGAAVIAGISTYLVSKSHQKHENRKTLFEKELGMLREIVTYTEESTSILNDFSHISRSISLPSEAPLAKENTEKIMTGYKIMGKAQGLSYLIGLNDLTTIIDKICKSLLNFYYYVTANLDNFDQDFANKQLHEINNLMQDLRNEISKAYKIVSPK